MSISGYYWLLVAISGYILSNILSDILSDMLSDILSDTLSNMMDGWPAGYDGWKANIIHEGVQPQAAKPGGAHARGII